MRALSRATVITTEYQRDSSSKRPSIVRRLGGPSSSLMARRNPPRGRGGNRVGRFNIQDRVDEHRGLTRGHSISALAAAGRRRRPAPRRATPARRSASAPRCRRTRRAGGSSARRHRCGRAAARPPRDAGRVPRVPGRAPHRELGRRPHRGLVAVRLADDDGPGQPLDIGRVIGREVVGEDVRRRRGREPAGADVVLDRDRHPEQGQVRRVGPPPVERRRPREGRLRRGVAEGPQVPVAGRDVGRETRCTRRPRSRCRATRPGRPRWSRARRAPSADDLGHPEQPFPPRDLG